MADDPWCRACGRGPAGVGRCDACGTPLDRPAASPSTGRAGLLRRRPQLSEVPLAVRRATAIDLIGQGRPLPAELDLTEAEVAWYRAHAAMTAGDLPTALDQLAKLPDSGYAARVGLLLSRFPELLAARDCWADAVAVLTPFAPVSEDARAMVAALDRGLPDVSEVARRYVGPGLGAGPVARALAAYQQTVSGEAPGVPDDLLRFLPAPLLGRLVAAGALTELPDGLPGSVAARIRSRLDLTGPEFAAEAARRAYLAADGAALARLDDGPDVRHYRALHDYVTSGRLREDDLRPEACTVIRLTDAVTIGFAGRRPVPDEVAADPTTWPRLWRNAVLGKLYPADGVAGKHPAFMFWLQLCEAYPALREGRWDEALRVAERVGAGTGDPRLRGEARNVAGYALWQLGRIEQALRELSGEAGAGLAVNATLVASSLGDAEALPHLARVMRMAEDAGLRRAAVREAAAIGERSGRVPATLTDMIREALALNLADDDLRQRVLALALRHDRAWLARGRFAGPRPDDRYFQNRAGYAEAPSTRTLTGTAAALGAILARPRAPTWTEAERRWLTDILVDPPDGVDALPAVEGLAKAGGLPLADALRLRALAGARQILAVDWSPRKRSPVPGEISLAQAADDFRHRAAELDASERAAVAAFLGRQLQTAVVAVCNPAIDFWNGLSDALTALRRSAARTWEGNRENMAARRDLVRDMEAHLDRSERLLRAAEGFPLDDEARRKVRGFHEQARRELPWFGL